MDQNDIFPAPFVLKLPNSFQEGLAFDIADSASHFNYGNSVFFAAGLR